MEINHKIYRIQLKHTFGISRSKNDWYDVALIYIKDGGIIGRGEAAPSIRYNETTERIASILEKPTDLPYDISERGKIWSFIQPQLKGLKSLEAGFSMALWDWWGQKIEKPIHELLNINAGIMPLTSYTISIGELDEIAPKLKDAQPYSILKVKLGTPEMDKEIIREIRRHTEKIIRVDANEGWEEDNALEMVNWLADQNIEFIEQPFPANKLEFTYQLKKKSPLDIYADENSLVSTDIEHIANAFHGINIKLMKCGSLEEGKKMINMARSQELKIMLGCMVETSVGITAASHLAGEVDVADLDGNLLIKNDPYRGVNVVNGKLVLSELNGSGLELNPKFKHLVQ